MGAPYRDDEMGKLQQENEKLREQYDGLMFRFSALRKWPFVITIIVLAVVTALAGVWAGNSASSAEPQRAAVNTLTYQDRRELGTEIARQVNSKISSLSRVPVSQAPRACPSCPVCANGTDDERVLGMNKVVVGTLGESRVGPRNEDWKFYARAGDSVVFRMKVRNGTVDSFLVLIDAQGNIVGSDDDSGAGNNATLLYNFIIPGVYILRCMDGRPAYNNSKGTEGSYTLSATRMREAR